MSQKILYAALAFCFTFVVQATESKVQFRVNARDEDKEWTCLRVEFSLATNPGRQKIYDSI